MSLTLNETLSLISMALSIALLVRGTGVWQGRREGSEANLEKRVATVEATLADRDTVGRHEFEQWTQRLVRLEDRAFRE